MSRVHSTTKSMVCAVFKLVLNDGNHCLTIWIDPAISTTGFSPPSFIITSVISFNLDSLPDTFLSHFEINS